MAARKSTKKSKLPWLIFGGIAGLFVLNKIKSLKESLTKIKVSFHDISFSFKSVETSTLTLSLKIENGSDLPIIFTKLKGMLFYKNFPFGNFEITDKVNIKTGESIVLRIPINVKNANVINLFNEIYTTKIIPSLSVKGTVFLGRLNKSFTIIETKPKSLTDLAKK